MIFSFLYYNYVNVCRKKISKKEDSRSYFRSSTDRCYIIPDVAGAPYGYFFGQIIPLCRLITPYVTPQGLKPITLVAPQFATMRFYLEDQRCIFLYR